jgi:glyoxylase-like metal-dependent hydrolase (beta-lactamase superfamily II)
MADADDFPEPEVPVDATDPADLWGDIVDGEPITILDVRVESEYEEWHIEGDSVEVANVPYFEFIEGLDDDLLEQVPESEPLLVVCAKGGASAYVAGVLKEEAGIEAVNLAEGMEGWARLFVPVEVERAPGPSTVVQYQRPSSGCLGYVVHEGDEAVVVDPLRAFTDRYVEMAEDLGVTITTVLDTHIHADHISGLRSLAAATGATPKIPEPAVARGVDYDVDYETVTDGETLPVGSGAIEVVHTPGHTSGMTAYYVDEGVLLTGDGLFVESVARPDLEEGADGAPDAARQLYHTLQDRVLALPAETVIAPGHFSANADTAPDGTYTARLGDLVERMAGLTMDEAAFVDLILSDMPPRPANFEDIIAINLGQQAADDEEAFELELGPNNCAASQEAMTGD